MSKWIAFLLAALVTPAASACAQEYEILAVRYGTIEGFPLAGLLPGSDPEETIDIAMAIWVIRDDERTVLFDTGFFRPEWFDRFELTDFARPDEAVSRAGIQAAEVTDVVISHAHWDHMGGLELFPEATVWIQEDEYRYYTGAAWQPEGRSGGIDRVDVLHLVERNMSGQVRLVPGDSVEILPGIRVFTGSRHTFASQYLMVDGSPRFVLASDNAYLYRNLLEVRASATFTPDDQAGNVAQVERMLELAGDPYRVVPGHDPAQFDRFPEVAEGVVRIRD